MILSNTPLNNLDNKWVSWASKISRGWPVKAPHKACTARACTCEQIFSRNWSGNDDAAAAADSGIDDDDGDEDDADNGDDDLRDNE